jgi:TetR/AcrR family transcriptional regulator, lmrAB and yxaGH operons repressor
MPRPPSDSRAKFVAATAKLLQTQGYRATSIKDIAAAADAPIGSLYFLFPGGKDELAIEALSQSGSQVRDLLAALLAEQPSGEAIVTTYLGAIEWLLTESSYTDGCPIATVALEAAPANTALADVIAEAFTSWAAVLQQALERVGLKAEAARIVATTSLAAVEGALIVARAQRDPAVFAHVRAGLIALVAHLSA